MHLWLCQRDLGLGYRARGALRVLNDSHFMQGRASLFELAHTSVTRSRRGIGIFGDCRDRTAFTCGEVFGGMRI